MDLMLSTQIATTHMLSKKKQTAVAILGVTFGIAMFIFMVSFMTGANDFLEETMLSNTPHIRIYNEIKTNRPGIIDQAYPKEYFKILHHQKPKQEQQNLRNGLQMVKLIQENPLVLGVSPLLTSQVFYNYGPHQITGSIAGVEILFEDKLFDLKSKMVEGKLEDLLASNNGIIIGSGLAKKMNIHKGDKVSVTTPAGNQMLLQVVGILKMGVSAIDNVRSYANLNTAQLIMQKGKSYITDINIKLKDLNEAKALAATYETNFGYRAEDWETANATILVSFTLRNFITYAVVFTLLTVAGFGIYNILNITIYSKMKDIAILKATGFSGTDVLSIFMTQALTIGVVGGLIGLVLGFIMSYAMSKVPFDGGDLMSIDHLPVNFDPFYYIVGIVFGLLTTALAGYFPSRTAAKVDPVEIIRG
jgi:lipoprotein-releasing system permease protein